MTLENSNINNLEKLVTPKEFKAQLPVSKAISEHVEKSRQTLRNIIDRKDDRLIVVVGPCSVHDTKAVIEYAERLAKFSESVKDKLFIVMRTNLAYQLLMKLLTPFLRNTCKTWLVGLPLVLVPLSPKLTEKWRVACQYQLVLKMEPMAH